MVKRTESNSLLLITFDIRNRCKPEYLIEMTVKVFTKDLNDSVTGIKITSKFFVLYNRWWTLQRSTVTDSTIPLEDPLTEELAVVSKSQLNTAVLSS